MGEISDIIDAVLYLQNATFVTGENIRVDGGPCGSAIIPLSLSRILVRLTERDSGIMVLL